MNEPVTRERTLLHTRREAGKIRNWWTPDTNKKFLEQTERLGAQYARFCPFAGVCMNGKLTMGQNIGDLGGLEMAYTAYKLSLNGQPAPVIDGFTGDQRFFIAHTTVWSDCGDDVQDRRPAL
jgi:putative endopeptidase